MGWRELRNAPLIEAFADRLRSMRGIFSHPSTKSSWPPAWRRCIEEGRDGARDELWKELSGLYSMPADTILTALIAWDDMHAIIALQPSELEAYIRMFPDTELEHRCLAAQIFDSVVTPRRAYELCASIANREVDERAPCTSDVAASKRSGGEEREGG